MQTPFVYLLHLRYSHAGDDGAHGLLQAAGLEFAEGRTFVMDRVAEGLRTGDVTTLWKSRRTELLLLLDKLYAAVTPACSHLVVVGIPSVLLTIAFGRELQKREQFSLVTFLTSGVDGTLLPLCLPSLTTLREREANPPSVFEVKTSTNSEAQALQIFVDAYDTGITACGTPVDAVVVRVPVKSLAVSPQTYGDIGSQMADVIRTQAAKCIATGPVVISSTLPVSLALLLGVVLGECFGERECLGQMVRPVPGGYRNSVLVGVSNESQ